MRAWLAERRPPFCDRFEVGTLDLSGPSRKVVDTMTPHATQVPDPFHLVKLSNSMLDECRRRSRTRPSATRTSRSAAAAGC